MPDNAKSLAYIIKYAGILALLSIVCFLIYANTLQAPFVFDDEQNISENPHIRMRAITLEQIAQIKNSPSPRPFSNFSFALNYYFHQYRLWGYHLINILIHIINALLFVTIANLTLHLCGSRHALLTAILAGFLWIAHPLDTQSVTYIVQRMTSLATLFYLLSLLCYIRARMTSTIHYGLVIKRNSLFLCAGAAGILGLASKQIVVTLPIVIFLYEWFFFQDLDADWFKQQIKWVLTVTILLGIIALIYLGDNPVDRIISGYAKRDFTLAERLLTQPSIVIFYISLIFFPFPSRLTMDYDFSLSTGFFAPPSNALAIIAIIILLSGAIMAARKHRLVSFAVLWFFGNLLLESSFIGLELIYEHRTYLPSTFPIIAISALIVNVRPRLLSLITALTLVCLLCIGTYQRNKVWRNALSLWTDNIAKSPHDARVHLNLGETLLDLGNTTRAATVLKRAIKLDPTLPNAYYGLAKSCRENRNYFQAVDYYQQGLQRDPLNATAYYNLGEVLQQMGKYQQAIVMYNKALEINPNYPEAYNNLGAALQQTRDFGKAIAIFQQALAIDPGYAGTYNNLGVVLAKTGRINEAIAMYRKALALDPDDPDVYNHLGLALADTGKISEAIAMYQKALMINPQHASTCNNLGLAMAGQGQPLKAISLYQKALSADPNYIKAYVNLGMTLIHLNQPNKAIPYLLQALQKDPNIKEIHTNLAIAYAQTGQLRRAINHCHQALTISPGCVASMYNLGLIYQEQGTLKKAIEWLSKAIAGTPDNVQMRLSLAEVLAADGNRQLAIAQLKTVLTLDPGNLQALMVLGTLYAKAKDNTNAISVYNQLARLLPDNPTVYYNLACLHARKNEITAAINNLRKAIAKGYSDHDRIQTDRDLDNIRQTIDYQDIMKDSFIPPVN